MEEAVLIGMMMATRLSVIKKICSNKVLLKLIKIYKREQSYIYFKNIAKVEILLKSLIL